MSRWIFAFVFVFGMIFTAAYMLMQQAIQPARVPTPAPKVEVAQSDDSGVKDEKRDAAKAIFISDLKPKDDESKSNNPEDKDPSTSSKQAQKDPNKPAASPKPGQRSARTSNQRNQKLKEFVSNASGFKPKPREVNGGIWDEDLDRLQGIWRIVEAEYDGSRIPGQDYKWVFKVDQYRITHNDNFCELWNVEVHSGRSPKTIDSIFDMTGQKLKGIYKVTDDELMVCYDLTGNSRPDKFKADKGSRWVVYFFKR